MDKPLVSVITPSFNSERYIERTLSSVLHQEYAPVEHIVVDGGSTDGTLSILRRYESKYDLRWVSEPDSGPVEAVNKGMRLSRGEIQTFVPSDDLFLPWTVKVVVEKFQLDPEAGIVYGDVGTMRMGSKWATIAFSPQEDEVRTFFRNLLYLNPPWFWRRDVYSSLGGLDERIKMVADNDMLIRALGRHKFGKVEEALILVRLRPDSQSRLHYRRSAVENAAMMRRHFGEAGGERRGKSLFALRWGIHCSMQLVRLLSLTMSRGRESGKSWRYLVGSGLISRASLAMNLLIPQLPTRFDVEERFNIGYIDAERLVEELIPLA